MRQILAGNAELAVDHHAGGDHDRVVGLDDLVPGQVAPDLDVARKTQVGLGEPPVELADDFVDCIVRLEAAEMVAAPLFWAAQRQTLGALEGNVRWSGLDENSGQWRQLRAHDGTSYRHLRAALQIGDRNGPIGDTELARFYDGVKQLAEDFQVSAEFPAAAVVLAHARALDEFCAAVDWRIGMNVVNLAGQTMAAARLIDLATETSLWLKDDGVFHAEDGSGQTWFTLSNLGGKPFGDGLGTLNLEGVTLTIDVPRVADGGQAFDRLLEVAGRLMASFDGTLVDDQRTPISDAMLATIRAKIGEFQDKMSAHEIPAGGRRALRLYS
ncbi:MAG: cell division protein ZipA C-terminal FtsZ-binding domain-containing protein [Sterolibacterium sp.]